MTEKHYKSDFTVTFDLTALAADGGIQPTVVPDCDIEVAITVGPPRPLAYAFKAWRRGTELHHCAVVTDTDGAQSLRVILDDHGLACGPLYAELTFLIPDTEMPDGIRRTPVVVPLDIVLTPSVTAVSGDPAAVSVTVPAVPVAGHLAAEWYNAKVTIADALTAKGYPTDPAEDTQTIADRIAAIPVLDTDSLDAADRGDLYSLCIRHQRGDYPYMTAVRFGAASDPALELYGADAYLTSDGAFYVGSASHTFPEDGASRWVIYYFDSEQYTVPTVNHAGVLEYCVYNGKVILPSFTQSVGHTFKCHAHLASPVLTSQLFNTASGSDLQEVGGAGFEELEEIAAGGWFMNTTNGTRLIGTPAFPLLASVGDCAFYKIGGLTSASLPSLTTAGASLLSYCTALTSASLPSLTTAGASPLSYCTALTSASLPSLTTAGNYLLQGCSALTSVSLPSLTAVGGSAIGSCTSLISVSLPALTTFVGGGNYFMQGCSALKEADLSSVPSWAGYRFIDCKVLRHVIFRTLTSANVSLTASTACGTTVDPCHIELGSQVNEAGLIFFQRASTSLLLYAYVTIEAGFRVPLNLTHCLSMTEEHMHALAANFGAGEVAVTLTLTSAQAAMLTEEELASLADRNVTIAIS